MSFSRYFLVYFAASCSLFLSSHAQAASDKQLLFLQAPSGKTARILMQKHNNAWFDVYCLERVKSGKGCVAEQVYMGNRNALSRKSVQKQSSSRSFASLPHVADATCVAHGGRALTLTNQKADRTPYCFFSKDQSLVNSWDLAEKTGTTKK